MEFRRRTGGTQSGRKSTGWARIGGSGTYPAQKRRAKISKTCAHNSQADWTDTGDWADRSNRTETGNWADASNWADTGDWADVSNRTDASNRADTNNWTHTSKMSVSWVEAGRAQARMTAGGHMPKRIPRLKAILSQALVIIFLIMFCLSFQKDISVPAFTGEQAQVDDGPLLSPSIFDILWQRRGFSKILLKAGFPMLGYMEELRKDYPMPGISLQIFGWFLGFTPRGVQDVVASSFPRFVEDYMLVWSGDDTGDPTKDWGVSPVLFSLPPGDGVIPATILSSNSPVVAIYHTHATESYLPELNKTKPSDAFTTDLSKSVVRVGEMLAEELERTYRIPVLHSKTVHDAESRVGAYYRSEATVTAIREKYPDCKILIDIHRDSQPKSLTAVTIGGKPYARMLLVVGTENPNWVANYNFSRQIINKLEERYPGITRGILYASAVYNQRYSPMAILVEVGGVDNTLVECRNSMQALAWALASVIAGSE